MTVNNRQNYFQIVLLIVFGVLTIIGVMFLAWHKNKAPEGAVDIPIVIWGPPLQNNAMHKAILALQDKYEGSYKMVSYVEKNPNSMYGELIETLASNVPGTVPDLVIVKASDLMPLRNKLMVIPYENIPLHFYRETWVEGAEVFALNEGIYAFPFLVDPLVLYWNRSIFTNEAIAQVPKDWDTFVEYVPRLSKIQDGADLTQSAIAFGEFDNVLHAREILSALMMQTGTMIVSQEVDGFKTDLERNTGVSPSGDAEAAFRFYTSFSNPVKLVYSWNKTYDRSREAFTANKVAMYGGFVSEESVLREINPNLNFDMGIWPQSNNKKKNITYGDFYGIAIVKQSNNVEIAYKLAQMLTSDEDIIRQISKLSGLPSARRGLLVDIDPNDPFSKVKIQSAIMSKTWIAPPPLSYVDTAFSNAINGIVSGTLSIDDGVSHLSNDLNALLKKYNK